MPEEQTQPTFRKKWLEAVEAKGSILCAGLDPAVSMMGRGEKGLPKTADKLAWSLSYLDAVAPYCAAIKPNVQYWKGIGDAKSLYEINMTAHQLGLVVIEDTKLADIGSTNDAGAFYAGTRADAVTFSPFAGNLEEATQQAHARGLGLISMCLMSNPEFEREKMKLVTITEANKSHFVTDIRRMGEQSFVPQYVQLAHDAIKYDADGVVIGAPSEKNHITEEEVLTVRAYVGDEMLILVPGVGAQGGEANVIWKYFGKDNVIVNVGRALMLPKGSQSTPEQQRRTAEEYRDMLNDLRVKAA